MKKAQLALVAVLLSNIFIQLAAQAAPETATVTPDSAAENSIASAETEVNPDPQETDPIAKLTQLALGGMSDLGGIFTKELPPPASRPISATPINQRLADQVAIGGASDATPSLSQHVLQTSESVKSGQGNSVLGSSGPEKSKMGFGMRGCLPMGRPHYRCPWEKLEGANALTDEQYQKLYDIKGQFIASIVPKGLNVWMLARKMKDLLNVADVDTNAVKDVEKQIAAATSDLSMIAMDHIIIANQVLTPAQRKELHRISIRSTLGGSGYHHDKAPHAEN